MIETETDFTCILAQSFAVDIWSFGVFIFEMLDGKAPFRNKSRVALADSILAGIDPVLKVSLHFTTFTRL